MKRRVKDLEAEIERLKLDLAMKDAEIERLKLDLAVKDAGIEYLLQADRTDDLQRDLDHVLARVPLARLRKTDGDLRSITDDNRTAVDRAREKRSRGLAAERERYRTEARRLRESPNDLDDTAIARVLTNKFPQTTSGKPRRPFSRQYVARLLGPRRPRRP